VHTFDGDEAEISTEYTGISIPEAALGKILDRVFTTKTVGKVTENGLAVARGINTQASPLRFESVCG
jgi:hypothetical protein